MKFFHRFFHKSEGMPAPILLRNSSWYENLGVVKFLGTTGRHFRMGNMLIRESVKSRLNSPDGMSLSEFSYQVFQAYDWLHLFEKYGCAIQIGQWKGNDMMNITLPKSCVHVEWCCLIQPVNERNVLGAIKMYHDSQIGSRCCSRFCSRFQEVRIN